MEIKNLVKRALKDVPTPKAGKGLVFLENLVKGAKFSLHNKTGTVIHTTPCDVHVEIDSYFSIDEDITISKHRTHWAGLTQVRKIK